MAKGGRERGETGERMFQRGCLRQMAWVVDPRRWNRNLQREEERGRVCDERMVSLENLVYLDGNDGAIGGCAGIGPIPKAATRSILTSLLTNGSKI